jgi:anti-sigma factor RsiW
MADDTPKEETSSGPPKRSWRRRLAFPVIILGAVGMMAYYSRTKPVEVTVIYDLGDHAARASGLTVSVMRDGKEVHPVSWTFPVGSTVQRWHRHKLTLKPGTYTVRVRLSLRASGARSAEVRKVQRRVEIASGKDQRITLRLR